MREVTRRAAGAIRARVGRRSDLSRRQAMALLGGGAVLAAESAWLAGWQPASWWGGAGTAAADPWPDSPAYVPGYPMGRSGYAPDGTAGATAAYPLASVRLLDSAFRANQGRTKDYLLFLDPNRMLHTFRLNYGRPSAARPVGGWEAPNMQVRGHTTGHLLSGLALTYASTGDPRAKAAGEYLVGELAQLQAIAPLAGYAPGYLSAFPESFFDRLEAGQRVWSPYYMIHKYLAGMIDQYQLAGVGQALDVAVRLADWVDARTARLSYANMQHVLETEYGGLPESLANLYRITGSERYLRTAQRFYHARFLDPLAVGDDALRGAQCNVSLPKVIASLRMWEETGEPKYRAIAYNFWQIATAHYSYIIGGQGNYEHWTAPDVVAGALSNSTCEGCVTYNMLKLTRLLHFHDLTRVDLLDSYERGLFNQMLGSQDPDSPHGFVCYYTGLSPGAFKEQPLNYFPGGDPNVYATDYDTFTCDNATGLETQVKFADTIYSRDARGVYVNLFIPSEVRCADQGITLRQTTGFPDTPVVRLTVVSGAAPMDLRVRVPGWTAGPPEVVLNGTPLRNAVVPAGSAGGWAVVSRHWQPGDWLTVTLPMSLTFNPAPDNPAVQAVSYGPVVLSGLYGAGYAAAGPDSAPGTAAAPSTASPPS
ncbi:MAG: glycoside hydrolase family 127 protein, partial [Trebonia sp.]